MQTKDDEGRNWRTSRIDVETTAVKECASGRSEEHSSKSILLLLVDNSSNVAEHCLKTSCKCKGATGFNITNRIDVEYVDPKSK